MIEKVNKNKFGVIEYLIEDMEDLKNLPKKDTDNTSYAIMRKGNEKLIYLYSSSAKEWVLINEDLSSIKSSLDNKASKIHSTCWYNIKELGASPKGDLNCDKIIQDIIDNSDGSIVIYAPQGKYLIDQVIIPSAKHGITFIGDVGYNYGGTHFISQDSDKSMFKIGNHHESGNSLDRLQGLTFKGITFKSNIELSYDLAVNKICLDVNRVSNLNITDCYFFGFRHGAIKGVDWWDSRIDYTSFIFCGTKDLYPSIYFGGNLDNSNAIKISNCRFENSPYFIETKQDTTRHIQFVSCKFECGDIATNEKAEYLLKLGANQEIVFIGNQFVCNNPFYYLFKIIGDSKKSIIINGNMFAGADTGCGKWFNQEAGSGLIITNNTFVNSSHDSPFVLQNQNIISDNKINFTYLTDVELKAFTLGQSNVINNNILQFPSKTNSGYVYTLNSYYNKFNNNNYINDYKNLYNFTTSNARFLNYIEPLKRERQRIISTGDLVLDYSLSNTYALAGGSGTNIIGITDAHDGAELTVYNDSTSDIFITKGTGFLENLSSTQLSFENRSVITFKRIGNKWYIKDYTKRSSLI